MKTNLFIVLTLVIAQTALPMSFFKRSSNVSQAIKSDVKPAFFNLEKETHVWPKMALEANWQQHLAQPTIQKNVKIIVDNGSSVQKEFTKGLFAFKRNTLESSIPTNLNKESILQRYDNRHEEAKQLLNNQSAVSYRSRFDQAKMPISLLGVIKARFAQKGINPDKIPVVLGEHWSAGVDRTQEQFYLKVSPHHAKLSEQSIKAAINHEIEHFVENDLNIDELLEGSCTKEWFHAQELVADQIPALESVEQATIVNNERQKMVKYQAQTKFKDADTHPAPILRLRATTMILAYLKAEQSYKQLLLSK